MSVLRRFLTFLTLCLFAAFVLAGCSSTLKNSGESSETYSDAAFLLDTVCLITVYSDEDSEVIDECFKLIESYENLFSRTVETSDISIINASGSANVSAETCQIVLLALTLSEQTDGAYDISVAPLTKLWDFTSGEAFVPDASDIVEAVSHVGYENIIVTTDNISLSDPDGGIDLGSIAKGYIADRVCDLLAKRGVKNAIVNLGGNISVIGSKPDGSGYSIGIQEPFGDHTNYIGYSVVSDLSIVTSGIYERYFEEDGVLYHHILDPKTGYPYDNGLISVTIFGPEATLCDGLSTACFSLGLNGGLSLVDSYEGYYAVFIDEDGELCYSDGFLDDIGITLN